MERLDNEYMGYMEDYIGCNVDHLKDGRIFISQYQSLQGIINKVSLRLNTTTRNTPALTTKILFCDFASPSFYGRFHYHGEIGEFDSLKNITCPEIV